MVSRGTGQAVCTGLHFTHPLPCSLGHITDLFSVPPCVHPKGGMGCAHKLDQRSSQLLSKYSTLSQLCRALEALISTVSSGLCRTWAGSSARGVQGGAGGFTPQKATGSATERNLWPLKMLSKEKWAPSVPPQREDHLLGRAGTREPNLLLRLVCG